MRRQLEMSEVESSSEEDLFFPERDRSRVRQFFRDSWALLTKPFVSVKFMASRRTLRHNNTASHLRLGTGVQSVPGFPEKAKRDHNEMHQESAGDDNELPQDEEESQWGDDEEISPLPPVLAEDEEEEDGDDDDDEKEGTSSDEIEFVEMPTDRMAPELLKSVGVYQLVRFHEKIENEFADRPKVFDEYLRLVAESKTKGELRRAIYILFKGKVRLLVAFEECLGNPPPPGTDKTELRQRSRRDSPSTSVEEAFRQVGTAAGTSALNLSPETKRTDRGLVSSIRKDRPIVNEYLDRIREAMKEKPDNFSEFLDVLSDFKEGAIDRDLCFQTLFESLEGLYDELLESLEEFVLEFEKTL